MSEFEKALDEVTAAAHGMADAVSSEDGAFAADGLDRAKQRLRSLYAEAQRGDEEVRELVAKAYAIGNLSGGWSGAHKLITEKPWPVEDDDYEVADAMLAEARKGRDGGLDT